MRIKDEFHNLIEKIDNETVLKGYLKLIQRLNNSQTGELWDQLSNKEKDELLISYEESFDPTNLIAHEDVKKEHTKWLRK